MIGHAPTGWESGATAQFRGVKLSTMVLTKAALRLLAFVHDHLMPGDGEALLDRRGGAMNPGWYPWDAAQMRYWDGGQWSAKLHSQHRDVTHRD
jgi:hypothetical protein